MIDTFTLATLTIAILVVSVLFSMLGLGGGALYTPFQMYAGINIHTAAATSLFLIMITSLSATIVYRHARKVDWQLAIAMEVFTGVGGFIGGLFSHRFSNSTLSCFFAGVLVVAAFFMIGKMKAKRLRTDCATGAIYWKRDFNGEPFFVNMLVAFPSAFLAGSASGLVGVGGGILNVPLMVVILGIPMDVSVGCSAFMVGITAASGLVGHLIGTRMNWDIALLLAVAVYVGGQIGARTSVHMNKDKLRTGFGWFLLLIAITMIIKGMH